MIMVMRMIVTSCTIARCTVTNAAPAPALHGRGLCDLRSHFAICGGKVRCTMLVQKT